MQVTKKKRETVQIPTILSSQNIASTLPTNFQFGAVLHEQYRLDEKLGEGGMGRVFKGTDLLNNRPVAIKQILCPPGFDHAELVERFKREYYFLNNIVHPHVVKVYDFFQENGQEFLVMEFLTGESLKTFLEKKARVLPLLHQVAIANQISRAVEVLNIVGILHRDIKPANIMLNLDRYQAKLLDFGLAKSLKNDMGNITASGTILGTTDYMSPEQVNGSCSPRSDIFSLAVTLYQFFLWMPQSPFHLDSSIGTMDGILTKELPPLHDNVSWRHSREEEEAYRALSAILSKAMEKDTEKRLANAGILAEELGSIYQTLLSSSKGMIKSADKWNLVSHVDTAERRRLEALTAKYGKDEIFAIHQRNARKHKKTSARFRALPSEGKNMKMWLGWLVAIVVCSFLLFSQFFSKENTREKPKTLPAKKTEKIPDEKNIDQKPSELEMLSQWRKEVSELDSEAKNPLKKGDWLKGEEIRFRRLQLYRKIYAVEMQQMKEKVEDAQKKGDRDRRDELRMHLKKIQLNSEYAEDRYIEFLEESAYKRRDIVKEAEMNLLRIELAKKQEYPGREYRHLSKMKKKNRDALWRCIELSKILELDLHYLFYMRQFVRCFPEDSRSKGLEQEIERYQNAWDMAIAKVSPTRQNLRKILSLLGYANVAKWDITDPYTKNIVQQIFQIEEDSCHDLMPLIQCIKAILYVKQKLPDKAQEELSKIKKTTQCLYPFISLHQGKPVWSEVELAQGIVYFANKQQNQAFQRFSWVKTHCERYIDNSRRFLVERAEFYDDFCESAWDSELNLTLDNFLFFLTVRGILNNEYIAQQNISQAIENYEDMLFLQMHTYMIQFKLGFRLVYSQNYSEAERHLVKAERFIPDFHEIKYLLAMIYYHTGRLEKAREYFLHCTVLKPEWSPWMVEQSKEYLQRLKKDFKDF